MMVLNGIEYPNCIAKELTKMDEGRQKVLSMIDDVKFAESLIEKFKELLGTSEWYVSVGYESGVLDGVNIHVTVKDMRELIHVRRWIREQGFPAPKIGEYAALHRKEWNYIREGHESFRLCGHTGWSEDAVCKYVQVGVKEEPVYELQCEGEVFKEEEIEKNSPPVTETK